MLHNYANDRSVERSYGVIEIVVAIVSVIVVVAVAIFTYNTRYDSSAQSSSGFELKYSTNVNSASSTLMASAGSVWYGCFQKSGKANTEYCFYYKPTSKSNYGSCVREVNFKKNGAANAKGDWLLAKSRYSQKYDIKVSRTSNKKTNSCLHVDWAVDSYNSTGK